MRHPGLAVLLVVGCGAGHRDSAQLSGSAMASDTKAFPATRWVPAKPTYVLAAHSVVDAQHALRDLVDGVGLVGGIDADGASRLLGSFLGVDLLHPDPVAGIGIDLHGGWAVFSDDLAPTLVVHLDAPDLLRAFFARQRDRGMVTQSVTVGGVEIVTAKGAGISWAIADGWLWVHAALPFVTDDGTRWFTASHDPHQPGWTHDWDWTQSAVGTAAPFAGFVDVHAMLGAVAGSDANACMKLLAPVGRAAIGISSDLQHTTARLALDLGASAAGVGAAILPAPGGWGGAASGAPLAVQWNLDLVATRTWLAPCVKMIGGSVSAAIADFDRVGIRAGRAVIRSFDPEAGEITAGALALDLTRATYLASLLDRIPLRTTLESDRTFGPYHGHRLTIPFKGKIDYVLTDQLALAAVGDGLLATVAGAGAGAPAPVASVDLAPPAMSAAAWAGLFALFAIRDGGRIVERLERWQDGHLAVTVDGSQLVLAVTGNRR